MALGTQALGRAALGRAEAAAPPSGFLAAWALLDDDYVGDAEMLLNTAGQSIGAQMITASDGSAFTGSVTVYVTGNAGTQAIGSVGSGACAHEGNGFHTYAPAQAETNYAHIAFTFVGTGAIPRTVQLFTRAGDAFTRLGAPAGASVSADIAAVKSDTAATLVDTAVIGAAGAGLTAVPWNAAWDAEVQSEVADALAAYDPPTKAELDSAVAPLATQSSVNDLPTNAELATALDALPTASENAAAVATTVVEGSVTVVQSLRLANAALGGKASGLETTEATYRDLADSKDRIVATVDADGNRTAVTRDLT